MVKNNKDPKLNLLYLHACLGSANQIPLISMSKFHYGIEASGNKPSFLHFIFCEIYMFFIRLSVKISQNPPILLSIFYAKYDVKYVRSYFPLITFTGCGVNTPGNQTFIEIARQRSVVFSRTLEQFSL